MKYQRFLAVGVFLLVTVACAPTPVDSTSAPQAFAPTSDFSTLSDNPVLQTHLERRLRAEGYGDLMATGRLAVSILDITDPAATYYAGVNDDAMLYAASLPKIAILLAFTQALADGDLPWEDAYDWRLSQMITVSDNGQASWAFDQVGAEAIADTMTDPRYALYTAPHGGLWAGRPYRRGGTGKRDPLYDISHGATTRQIARFYAMLDAGQLVSARWSERMLDWMGPAAIRHKFVAGLHRTPGVRFIARKSGTWRSFNADSALIEHAGHKYIIAALSDTYSGERVLRHFAQIADKIVLDGAHRHDATFW